MGESRTDFMVRHSLLLVQSSFNLASNIVNCMQQFASGLKLHDTTRTKFLYLLSISLYFTYSHSHSHSLHGLHLYIGSWRSCYYFEEAA